MPFWLKDLLVALALPPGNVLVLLLPALLMRCSRWRTFWVAAAAFLLYVQALPPVAGALIGSLERHAGPVLENAGGAGAIVILSGGIDATAPEYGGETAGQRTLARLRYGALLAKRLNLPVLVTGGQPAYAMHSEADIAAGILEREFGVPVRWRETRALNTEENAAFSAQMLRAAGVTRVVLVTQAFHMPRAAAQFRAAGLEVVTAPTDFRGGVPGPANWRLALPRMSALVDSYYALHEWLGIAWAGLAVDGKPAG